MYNKKSLLSLFLVFILVFLTACSTPDGPKDTDEKVVVSENELSNLPEVYNLGKNTKLEENQNFEKEDDKNFEKIETTLSNENPSFSKYGISIEVSKEFLDKPVDLNIKKMIVTPPYQNLKQNTYDFSINNNNLGPIKIEIPYPKDYKSGDEIGAGYFNEETNSWEGVYFKEDSENEKIIIFTDHLSIYSCFAISGENTRYAKIDQIFGKPYVPSALAGKEREVLKEAINNNLRPTQKAVDFGLGITNDTLGISGALLQVTSTVYETGFLDDLSTSLGHLGTAVALVQVGADYSRGGKPDALFTNALKNITNYMVSKFGSSLMQTAFVAVFAIDYSLNKLIQTTLDDRKNIWVQAYKLYYEREQNRTAVEWYKKLKKFQNESKNIEEFKTKFNNELNKYSNLFWNESDETIPFYQGEAQKSGYSVGGGLNKKLKSDISKDFRTSLMRGRLQAVFNRLEIYNKMQQHRNYMENLKDLKKKLNTLITLEIIEEFKGEKPKYSGYYVKFGKLEESIDEKLWIGRMNEEGSLRATFTVLGHMQAGSPDKLFFYKTLKDLEKNNPSFEKEFKIEIPNTKIIIESKEKLKKLQTIDKYKNIYSQLIDKGEYISKFKPGRYNALMSYLLYKNPILIPSNDVININLSDYLEFEENGEYGGEKVAPGTWKTSGLYQIHRFNINLKLDQNEILPVINKNNKALLLRGSGTYNIKLTTEINNVNVQENPSFGQKVVATVKTKETITYIVNGNIKAYAQNKKLDPDKNIVVRKTGIENINTEGVLLEFEEIGVTTNGEYVKDFHWEWEDGEEKSETHTKEINNSTEGKFGTSVYFKFDK